MKLSLEYLKSKWQLMLSIISIVSLIIHYFVKFALKIDENYSLIFVLIIGGIPLLIQIFLKILKGNLGADLIAFMALILAIYLHENVAGVLIILMLASSQALEEFASHRATKTE